MYTCAHHLGMNEIEIVSRECKSHGILVTFVIANTPVNRTLFELLTFFYLPPIQIINLKIKILRDFFGLHRCIYVHTNNLFPLLVSASSTKSASRVLDGDVRHSPHNLDFLPRLDMPNLLSQTRSLELSLAC